jgi:hypothetical protein
MYEGAERREYPRREVALPVEIESVIDGGFAPAGSGTTMNISPAGALIKTSIFLAEGTVVRLRISGEFRAVRTLARVVRVALVRDQGFQVAVNFAKKRKI